ncbi:MAG: c-type cytochrome [Rubellimicrobium sp.]|nr:c-type cytochrome [Rubellimicrobium sp.]
MPPALRWLIALVLLGGGLFCALTRPASPDPSLIAGLTGDPEAGRLSFAAAGCAACHIAPGATLADEPVLSGGRRFDTAFGTFVAPNISPSAAGIGDWSDEQIVHAVMQGVSPRGRHYYPAFPYTAYILADPQDILDLAAYLRSLPPDDTPSAGHDLRFPYGIRRGLGLWKRRYLREDWVLTDAPTPEIARGRTLVEAMGHCAECHTPRDRLGGLDRSRWMAGAPLPSGDDTVPAIHPDLLGWTDLEIAYYLETGFTPAFDSAGGAMAEVIHNTRQLPAEDRAAIAAYLLALP